MAGHHGFQFEMFKMQEHGLSIILTPRTYQLLNKWMKLIAVTYTRQNQYFGNAMSHYEVEQQSCQCPKSWTDACLHF